MVHESWGAMTTCNAQDQTSLDMAEASILRRGAKKLFRLLLFFVVLASAPAASAQVGWPAKPVKLVVPYPAGGSGDFVARIIAQKMSENWGQPVVVENRPGAIGNIGTEFVA